MRALSRHVTVVEVMIGSSFPAACSSAALNSMALVSASPAYDETWLALKPFGHRLHNASSTVARALVCSSSCSPSRNMALKLIFDAGQVGCLSATNHSASSAASLAACSTAEPTRCHHVLNRVSAGGGFWARNRGLPSRMVYSAQRILPR